MDSSGENLRIADFGAAAKIEDHQKFFVVAGTPPYMAPEVVRAYPPQKKIAHFSLDGDKRYAVRESISFSFPGYRAPLFFSINAPPSHKLFPLLFRIPPPQIIPPS